MRNILFFPLVILSLSACDRLKLAEVTKVQILLPNTQMSSASTETLNGKSVSAMRMIDYHPTPTGFSGSQPINCYLIAYSGPEESMKRNSCTRKDASIPARLIGGWVGGSPAGSALTLDIPAGLDRSIIVIGFYAPEGTCHDYKVSNFPDGLSKPHVMGELSHIDMKGGETLDLSVPITFNANRWFDDCAGPDFPDGGKGDGNSPATKISFQKNYFPYNKLAADSCQGVYLTLLNDQGYQSSLLTATTATIMMNGTPLSLYNSMDDCNNLAPTHLNATIPASTSSIPLIFRTPPLATASLNFSVDTLSASSLLNKVPFAFDNLNPTLNSFDIAGPDRILANVCYKYSSVARQVNGNSYMPPSIAVGISPVSGIATYSDSTCTTAISTINYPGSIPFKDFYVKMDGSSASASLTLAYSGYVSSTRYLNLGAGGVIPAQIELRGDTDGPIKAQCYAKPSQVYLLNDQGTVVPAPSLVELVPSLINTVNIWDATVGNCYGSSVTTATPLIIPVGSAQADVWFVPTAAGPQKLALELKLTPTAKSSYTINADGPNNFSFNPAVLSAPNGACVPLEIIAKNYKGSTVTYSSKYYSIPTTAEAGTVLLNLYSDAACQSSIPSGGSTSGAGDSKSLLYVKLTNNSGMPKNFAVTVGGDLPGQFNVNVDSADPCLFANTPGTVCQGGSIFAGIFAPNGMRYMTTRGNCDFSGTSCSGGLDSLALAWGPTGVVTGFSAIEGAMNTMNLANLGPSYAAAKYCSDLVFASYSDWFLPSKEELNEVLFANRYSLDGLVTATYPASLYISSSEANNNSAFGQAFDSGSQISYVKNGSANVRCVRKY